MWEIILVRKEMSYETCYVIFKHSEKYKNVLKHGFGHVFVVKKDKSGKFVVIDPQLKFLNIKTYSFDIISFYKKKDYKIIKLCYIQSNKRFFKFFGLFSCVNFVKYTLNLNCNSLTPYGLYKYLLKPKVNVKQKHSIILMAEHI